MTTVIVIVAPAAAVTAALVFPALHVLGRLAAAVERLSASMAKAAR